jgi:hypothetical protein
MGDTVDREEGKVNPLEVGTCLPGGMACVIQPKQPIFEAPGIVATAHE